MSHLVDGERTKSEIGWERFADVCVVDQWPVKIMIGGVGGDAAKHLVCLGWGRMWSAHVPRPLPGEEWGLDNGAWSAWSKDEPFPEKKFLQRIEKTREQGHEPYLAVIPDKVQQANESLDFSLEWRERLMEEGYGSWPWYLSLQAGMDPERVRQVAHRFDGLFLGGGNEAKPAASLWKAIADQAGLPLHYAQCGTRGKLQHAHKVGADSLDTTSPVYSLEKLRNFQREAERLALIYGEEEDQRRGGT